MTYSDAKFAYEAYNKLNNITIEYADLVLEIHIFNEKSYQLLIQQELMDCLSSLNYFNNNMRKLSVLGTDYEKNSNLEEM